jgi:hypothetical protein
MAHQDFREAHPLRCGFGGGFDFQPSWTTGWLASNTLVESINKMTGY